jgi:hypothetical protein
MFVHLLVNWIVIRKLSDVNLNERFRRRYKTDRSCRQRSGHIYIYIYGHDLQPKHSLLFFLKNDYKRKAMISTDIAVTWLITLGGGGAKSTMGIRSHIIKTGKIGWNQIFFYLVLFSSVAKKLFLRRKILGWGHLSPLPPPQVTPMST